MTPLEEHLIQLIRRAGPITLERFMAEALGHPRYGYYTTRDPLGRAGDFITAPEISQIFGELIGLWCADLWMRMGAPDPVNLVELGPGRGTLMADALRVIETAAPDFAGALRLHLVETSPVLRRLQAERLEATWHADVGDLPGGPMILIANEFFDALPVRQLVRTADGWCERLVGVGEPGGRLVLTLGPPAPEAAGLVGPDHLDAAIGTCIEVSPQREAVMTALARRLVADGGALLVIDYGPAAGGPGDSVQAVRGHRFTDILEAPGEVDLTAHVDFAALTRTAVTAGADVCGPVSQGRFLGALGIEARARQLLASADARQAADIRSGVARLTAPEAMGELFKVLAATAPGGPPPAGFGDTAA